MSIIAESEVTIHGPPAPQSSTRSYDRMKGLEAAILLRKSEIDALRLRREQLQHMATARIEGNAGAIGVDTAGKKKKKSSESEDPSDPLNNPIVRLCNDGNFSMFQVPPERFSDTCIELEVATDSLVRHSAITQKQIAELEFENRGYEKEQTRLNAQIQLMCDLTGMPIAAASQRTAAMTKNHLKRNEEDAKTSTAPGYKMLRAMQDGGSASPTELKAINDDLRKYVQTLTKETREAGVIMLKKERAIKELAAQVEGRRRSVTNTLQLFNDIRVKDREVRERKAELRAILEEHERLDVLIDSAAVAKAGSSAAIMDRDLSFVKQRITECLDEERRQQDRVSKAQEYRLSILNRRVHMILDCVKTHKLDEDVEAMIAATLELQRQQEVSAVELAKQVARGATPVANNKVASAGKRSGTNTPAAPRTPIVKSGQLVIAQASHKQAANEIAALRRDELYDIDTIIPPNESIHPAIYSLFVSEKEALTKKAVTMKLIAEEKMAAVEALAAKTNQMHHQMEAADSTLIRTAKNIKLVESQKKFDLLEEVTANRVLLQQAVAENVRLSNEVRVKKPIAAAASKEYEQRELRRATLQRSPLSTIVVASTSTPASTPGAGQGLVPAGQSPRSFTL